MRAGAIPVGPAVRVAVTGVLAAVFWAVPREALAAAPTLCLFKRFAGVECYGCGLTRAVHALAHGDLAGALAANILVIPLAIVVAAVALHDAVLLVTPARPPSARAHDR